MEKTILIGDKEVKMKSTGSLIWIYRSNFKSDFLKDLINMQKELENGKNDISSINMEVFEKIAWCMAKSADPTIPEIEKWLDQFGMVDIMIALPEIMTLISDNMEQLNASKKKLEAIQK
jgi:hypothetical protein